MLKRPYGWLVSGLNRDRPRVREIDLRRTLIGGEGKYDAGRWADITGDMQRASTLLKDSPHVKFLEQYCVLGEKLFLWKNFAQTSYYQNAVKCVQFWGDYFGHRSREGILAHARSFAAIYERMKNGDGLEVRFPFEQDGSHPQSLPLVRETLTPNTFQIVAGHHRLAIAWVLGQQKTKAGVFPPPMATALQSLVMTVHQTGGGKELYHPIEGPEFDSSWGLVRRCDDRFALMLRFLASTGHKLSGLSVIDLGCSYGWFVSEFSKRGCHAIGVDRDPAALKIGRIAYGLHSGQLVQSDIMTFLHSCDRTFDVVLLLSILQNFAQRPDFARPEEVLERIDAITGFCLFFDTGQNHEEWYRNSLPEWNSDFIVKFVRQHTSFTHVSPLGVGSDNVGSYSDNYARTLFVCVRS